MKVYTVMIGLISVIGFCACKDAQKVSSPNTQLETLTLKGLYQGRNLFIQNPFHPTNPNHPNPVGAQKYWINGELMCNFQKRERTCKWSSAFEVEFDKTLLRIGDSVTVQVAYYPGSKPKCLNPEVMLPMSTYKVVDISVSKEGILKWSTKGETGKLPFGVEQFRWGKWINLGTVPGKGVPVLNNYTFDVQQHLHSGTNKFRISQTGYRMKPRLSKHLEVDPSLDVIYIDPLARKFRIIRFNAVTRYEVEDSSKNVLLKGYGNEIDLSRLKRGEYYLRYDNTEERFLKK